MATIRCVLRLSRLAHASIGAAFILLSGAPLWAQEPDVSAVLASCEGMVISEIDIAPTPAPAIVRGFSRAVLRYATTRPDVIRAFLLLREGGTCSDLRRSESARILRRQRYLASARVHALPDTGGTVRLLVETSDEIPLVIGGDLGGGFSALTFGTSNFGGRGLLTAFSWRDGEAYRDGWGVRVEQTPLLNRPWRFRGDAQRDPLGHVVNLRAGHEFLTTLQPLAWHAAFSDQRLFVPFTRAEDPFPVAVVSDRSFWNAGAVIRIAGRATGIFGGVLLTHDEFSRTAEPVVVSDTGLVELDPAILGDRYPSFSTTRIAGVLGLRALRFHPEIGYTTLASQHDLATGVQAGLQIGRSAPWFGGGSDRDQFVALDLYGGGRGARWFVGGSGQIEARRDLAAERWDGIIGSSRVAWFWKPTVERTWEVSTEFSGGWRERLPMQLTLGERSGGLRGFRTARDGGARRVVTRVERRQLRGHILGERAAWGYGLFADGGKLWSGTVPYGVTTSVRGSVGASLLAAIPADSRRMIRFDVAVPVTTGSPDDWQVRLYTVTTFGPFWREPNDVHRARTTVQSSNIFQWP